jgi:competence protein ComEA
VRVRAALGGVVVLALLGLGTAVVVAVMTPGGETVAVEFSPEEGADGGGLGGAGVTGGSGGAEVLDGSGSSDRSAGAAATEVVVLHVLGAVVEPGIVEVPLGSRVIDAIAAARGPAEDAELGGVNLARVVIDGEQLWVPRVGEVPPGGAGGVGVGAGGGAGGGSGGAGASGGTGVDSQGRVNINTADAAALETLAGVGPALAARIIAWREQNGPFRSVDELTAVSGIGPRTLDGMRNQVTL